VDLNLSELPSVPINQRRNLPAATGVYLVISGLGAVVYVGKSRNIQNRWMAHHRLYDVSGIAGAHIVWLLTEDERKAAAIEDELIERFNPPLNVIRRAVERIGFLVRMPANLHAALKDRAREQGRSLNAEIDYLLRRAVEERNRTPS
jgi:hypothetical protein